MKTPKCDCNGKTMCKKGRIRVYMPDGTSHYTYAFKCETCDRSVMVRDQRD